MDEGEALDAAEEVDEFVGDHGEFGGGESGGGGVGDVGECSRGIVFEGKTETRGGVAGHAIVVAVREHREAGVVLEGSWAAALTDHLHSKAHMELAVGVMLEARLRVLEDGLYEAVCYHFIGAIVGFALGVFVQHWEG